MFTTSQIGIIADDLTGANDTALQFHLAGANTQILLSADCEIKNSSEIQAYAIPTETRNIDAESAYNKVKAITTYMHENMDIERFYKKIDSTLRGNIAIETLAMLEVLDYDAAVIMPAFPNEGRVTIGGYHLLKGVPIEKTEMATDPHSPIYDSHIPTILEKQIGESNKNIIGSIELKTVLKGAGPILEALNEQVKLGKKLIVVDAVSTTDIEQATLAIDKCSYEILTCGSAGAAQAMSKIFLSDCDNCQEEKHLQKLPKLIVSGSATQLSANQIHKLEESDEIENTYLISLTADDFINGISDETYNRILSQLQPNNVVVVHASDINKTENLQAMLLEHELTKQEFASKIVEIIANLVKKIDSEKEFVLITIGGETSYECCKQINSNFLNLLDAAAPAIPLCINDKGKLIVTKSGNLGTINTLIEILKYIERHE